MMLRDFEGYRAAKACANMFDSMTGRLLFPPFQIWSVAGIKIGFIGYNDPLTSIRQSPAYSRGIRFGTPEQSLAKYVTILRREHGCALVAVVAHMGLAKQLDLANRPFAEGVDYILGADTHERIRQPLAGRFARVTEPGAFGSFLGRLDLVVEEGRIREESYTLLEVDPETTRADPETEALVAAARAPYQDTIGRVIGTTRTPLFRYYVVETTMDNLITDALMWRFGTDIVASNGFRFGPPLVPRDGGLAEITMDYLWSMLPIDSEVKRAEVTGRQVVDWLEQELENAFAADPTKRFGGWFVRFKGMKIRFRAKAAVGSRLEQVLVGEQPLDLRRVYSLLACEREGDPDNVLCRMKQVKRATRVDVRLHDVLVDYLAKFSPVSPVIEGRAVATDVNLPLLSQVDVLDYEFR
jgi:2',3'-cyclic-nucleotide 2'-phosphodiesterase (5'-nucleotidase family)